MKLIVGLGNPGSDYSNTYHNIGFIAADKVAALFRAPDFVLDKKSNAYISDSNIYGQKVLLVKPNTYMNLSGDAVGFIARYYKIAPQDILVIYDDIDMPRGTVRARQSGSSGTHNGMRDIVAKLSSEGFARVRIGIGPKPNYMALADYVLSKMPAPWSNSVMDKACGLAAEFVEDWISGKPWQDLTKTVKIDT
ncbi:MAG: aminoacyl-tRNA hydrolase [Clostridiales bacterium]|nr:aminoacyl-tRNA hydrolase [Clostridiales bacterium]